MGADEAAGQLADAIDVKVVQGERMARHTSLRVGGQAGLYVTCDSYSALREVNDVLAAHGVPWVVMGRGCGVIVSDQGYPGAVIALGRDFSHFYLDADFRLHVGAGTSMQRIVQEALALDLTGLEPFAGLPGTVGGAVSTNAWAPPACMGDLVEGIVAFRPGEGLVKYSGRDISWYRRMSDIPAREIILEVTLALGPGDPAKISQQMGAALTRRNASQPLRRATCDAIFADPVEEDAPTASRAIAACGLSGYTRGRAQICATDPNFIVNLGGATAADVTGIMIRTLSEVRHHYGIELRPQVKFLGFPS